MPQQQWAVSADGGFLGNTHLSKMLRYAAQPMMRFRQIVEPFDASGRNRGDTLLFDKIGNVSTAGGSIAETATIPMTKAPVRQGSAVMTEFANSIPYTGKLESLAEYDVEQMIITSLKNDMAKTLDSACAVQYTAGKIKAVCNGTTVTTITSDGTATATASANMGIQNVRDIVDDMRRRNTPPYDAEGNYIAVCSVNALRGVYDTLEPVAQYTVTGVADIGSGNLFPYKNERGRYYGVRFIEENRFLSNAKGTSSNKGEAVFVGGDAVREYVAVPEEIRVKIPTDFGRDKAIAWYYLGTFQRIWDQTTDSEDHLVHVTSA